jgi:hypothetical protein
MSRQGPGKNMVFASSYEKMHLLHLPKRLSATKEERGAVMDYSELNTAAGTPSDADFLTTLGLQADDSGDATRVRRPPSKRRQPRKRVEADERKDCVALLNRIGYCIIKHQTLYGVRGTPDILACVKSRMVVVEMKKQDGDPPTADQIGQLRRWQDAGALAGWARNVAHLHELLEHLEDLTWRNDFALPGDGRAGGKPW